MTTEPIRVLLADDHAVVRKGIREFLEEDPDLLVVAEASDGREALRLAGQGLTNKAIGLELGIGDRTVQGHLASIYGKLGAGSRTDAVTRALRLGWIVLESK